MVLPNPYSEVAMSDKAPRLSHIVTRNGDQGTTSLADGSRRPKNDVRLEALGEVDELNSLMGLLLTEVLPQEVADTLAAVQNDLFDLGAELALPGKSLLTESHLGRLEFQLAEWNATLPPLEEFLLPGGCRPAALCHVARAVCRRVERRVVALADSLPPLALPYLNRLSDLLFVAARIINREAGCHEPQWKPGKSGH